MDIARVYPDARVRLIRPSSFGIGRLGYAIAYSRIITKVLVESKINITLLYSAPTNGVQTILAAKRLEIPVIFRSIDVLHKLAPKWLSVPTQWAEKWVYQHVDRVLTITPALSRYVVSFGANHDKVKVLPLGIDTKAPTGAPELPMEAFSSKKGIKILFAGTLPVFCGLDDFLLSGVLDDLPGAELAVVGDGPQRQVLEDIARKHGWQDRVRITGMVPHRDVPYYISQADVCLNTFRNSGATRDILPTKVLQYMAQGRPVVSVPLDGMVDMGLGREQGVVYAQNGYWTSAVADAVVHTGELGEKARRYVEQEHGYDTVIVRMEKELEGLCASR
jgi:glycosyltransferase involved in cell wall biosynthesis